MSCRLACLFAAAAALSGCVPVTEPLADESKAAPDRRLIGDWDCEAMGERMRIDVPVVKGNPKGLMRAVNNGDANDPGNVLWFTVTTIGKHAYANILLAPGDKLVSPDLGKDGAFATWRMLDRRRYFVMLLAVEEKKLVVDAGSFSAVDRLMTEAKFRSEGDRPAFYLTPAGWLAKHLETAGPAAIYDGTNTRTYERKK